MCVKHIRSTVLTAALLILCLSAEAATIERPDHALRALLIKAISESNSFADRFDAEVWLTDMSGRLSEVVVDPEEREEIGQRSARRLRVQAGERPARPPVHATASRPEPLAEGSHRRRSDRD